MSLVGVLLYPLSVRMTILVPAGMALSTRASVACRGFPVSTPGIGDMATLESPCACSIFPRRKTTISILGDVPRAAVAMTEGHDLRRSLAGRGHKDAAKDQQKDAQFRAIHVGLPRVDVQPEIHGHQCPVVGFPTALPRGHQPPCDARRGERAATVRGAMLDNRSFCLDAPKGRSTRSGAWSMPATAVSQSRSLLLPVHQDVEGWWSFSCHRGRILLRPASGSARIVAGPTTAIFSLPDTPRDKIFDFPLVALAMNVALSFDMAIGVPPLSSGAHSAASASALAAIWAFAGMPSTFLATAFFSAEPAKAGEGTPQKVQAQVPARPTDGDRYPSFPPFLCLWKTVSQSRPALSSAAWVRANLTLLRSAALTGAEPPHDGHRPIIERARDRPQPSPIGDPQHRAHLGTRHGRGSVAAV